HVLTLILTISATAVTSWVTANFQGATLNQGLFTATETSNGATLTSGVSACDVPSGAGGAQAACQTLRAAGAFMVIGILASFATIAPFALLYLQGAQNRMFIYLTLAGTGLVAFCNFLGMCLSASVHNGSYFGAISDAGGSLGYGAGFGLCIVSMLLGIATTVVFGIVSRKLDNPVVELAAGPALASSEVHIGPSIISEL
ncbi:hypothetical protein HK405_013685, partial [Cladochytrium tenue]